MSQLTFSVVASLWDELVGKRLIERVPLTPVPEEFFSNENNICEASSHLLGRILVTIEEKDIPGMSHAASPQNTYSCRYLLPQHDDENDDPCTPTTSASSEVVEKPLSLGTSPPHSGSSSSSYVVTAGMIVEDEAYCPFEKASHCHMMKSTERTKVMYRRAGTAYVYKCYGVSDLINIVYGPEGMPVCCLIRALTPIVGLCAIQERVEQSRRIASTKKEDPKRLMDKAFSFCRGPGLVCRALGINRHDHHGTKLHAVTATGAATTTAATDAATTTAATDAATTTATGAATATDAATATTTATTIAAEANYVGRGDSDQKREIDVSTDKVVKGCCCNTLENEAKTSVAIPAFRICLKSATTATELESTPDIGGTTEKRVVVFVSEGPPSRDVMIEVLREAIREVKDAFLFEDYTQIVFNFIRFACLSMLINFSDAENLVSFYNELELNGDQTGKSLLIGQSGGGDAVSVSEVVLSGLIGITARDAPSIKNFRTISRSPRIGIGYAEEDTTLPWRFSYTAHKAVSIKPTTGGAVSVDQTTPAVSVDQTTPAVSVDQTTPAVSIENNTAGPAAAAAHLSRESSVYAEGDKKGNFMDEELISQMMQATMSTKKSQPDEQRRQKKAEVGIQRRRRRRQTSSDENDDFYNDHSMTKVRSKKKRSKSLKS